MPIVNVKSPEIMQADAEAERQRLLDRIAPRIHEPTAEDKMQRALVVCFIAAGISLVGILTTVWLIVQ